MSTSLAKASLHRYLAAARQHDDRDRYPADSMIVTATPQIP
jgi:hypothetical protein